MDYKEELVKLEKKIDNNTNKIKQNENKINVNEDKIDDHLEKIQKNSYALDILKDYKEESKRWYRILIIVLIMWFLTIGYLVYVLTDT